MRRVGCAFEVFPADQAVAQQAFRQGGYCRLQSGSRCDLVHLRLPLLAAVAYIYHCDWLKVYSTDAGAYIHLPFKGLLEALIRKQVCSCAPKASSACS